MHGRCLLKASATSYALVPAIILRWSTEKEASTPLTHIVKIGKFFWDYETPEQGI